ncbi:prolipoprotein diacylglyceryl transferase [bacterium C-53]|nr:prolipoprotein diacylglyceryl transferase [Lachnospiraceae bacterium]NBI03322.1 prolipoprotein diacylglyceryl transferase [Lachnospiraceae bacterium]RKJ09866.1 prolipoprotein diacylglyceryl transferase [bacterium C-53]
MGVNDIAFPNLGIYLEDIPRKITVGGFDVAFYGMIIGFGMILACFIAAREIRNRGMDENVIWDLSLYVIICSIAGARIYYVATSWEKYKDNLLSIFNLRQGGLAIYGGVIAGAITVIVYCRKKKISFLPYVDAIVMGLLTGQIIGRWGNFFNREAFGDYTDGLFAMRLPIDAVRASDISDNIAAHIVEGTNYIQVHPTFLYEGIWNLALLIFVILYRKHKRFEGEIFCIYALLYGAGRFVIESVRTDQLLIPGTAVPISMVVAAVSVLVSGVVIVVMKRKKIQVQYLVDNVKDKEKI